jgi:hypothetical protein
MAKTILSLTFFPGLKAGVRYEAQFLNLMTLPKGVELIIVTVKCCKSLV